MANNEQQKPDFKLLFLISNQKIYEKAQEIMSRHGVGIQYNTYAHGTAPSEIADLLGLGGVDKSVLISIVPGHLAVDLMNHFKNQLYLGMPNTGIAFTSPVSGCSRAIKHAMEQMPPPNSPERNDIEHMDNKYSLIMAFVNRGYNEDVMAAARSLGAGGGSVFHARRVGGDESVKLWGVSIQPEREIVMLLVKRELKIDIMKAIVEKCGVKSEAQGTVISLPVDSAAGLREEYEEE